MTRFASHITSGVWASLGFGEGTAVVRAGALVAAGTKKTEVREAGPQLLVARCGGRRACGSQAFGRGSWKRRVPSSELENPEELPGGSGERARVETRAGGWVAWGSPRESPGQRPQGPMHREAMLGREPQERSESGRTPGPAPQRTPSSQKVPGEHGLCPAQGLWGPQGAQQTGME